MRVWDIFEARRNPEQNVKEHALTQLLKYEGQKDVFVSFTAGFDTHFPNPETRRTVKAKGGQHKIGVYPQSRYETPLGIYTYPVDYLIEYSLKQGEVAGPFMGSSPWKYLYVVRRATSDYIESKTDVAPYMARLRGFTEDQFGPDKARDIFQDAESESYKSDAHSVFWNTVRNVAMSLVAAKTPGFGKKSSVAWNVVMRKIGILQYSDDAGQGIVHSNEPTQAVFFTAQAFRVIDVIDRDAIADSDEKYENVITRMADRRIDPSTVNPKYLTKLISQRLWPDQLKWIADQLQPIQKRIVSQSLRAWPHGYEFNAENVEAIRAFGPISTQVIIQAGVRMPQESLVNWPEWFGHFPTREEWKEIFDNYNGGNAQYYLTETKAPWVTSEFLKQCIEIGRESKRISFSYEDIKHVIELNSIEPNGVLLESLFGVDAKQTLDDYPHFEPSFKDWVRAYRMNRHGVATIIPTKYAAVLVQRDDKNEKIPRELTERLVSELPELMVKLYPQNSKFWQRNSSLEIDEFVQKNFVRMARISTRFVSSVAVEIPRNDEIMANIWKNKQGDVYSNEVLPWALGQGWVTPEEYLAHLTKENAWAITGVRWKEYWPSIPDELLVRVNGLTGTFNAIPARLLGMFSEMFPDTFESWYGYVDRDLAYQLYIDYPKLREFSAVIDHIAVDKKIELYLAGYPILQELNGREIQQLIVVMLGNKSYGKDTFKTIFDPNGKFRTTIDSIWSYINWASIPIKLLIDAGSEGCHVDDITVRRLFEAYERAFADLKIIVSRETMEWVAHKNLAWIIRANIFGNPIPDDLRTKFQCAWIDQLELQISDNSEADQAKIIQMMYEKILNPTPETTARYAKYLNYTAPPTA